jgi:hypothetical protein
LSSIDLGGIGPVRGSFVLLNGSFFIRGPVGQYYATNWANIGDPAANQGRTELVRYTSPTWQGFVFDSSIAEAGDYWGSMLRYANEFNGVRVAAGIGYERIKDRLTNATLDPTVAQFAGPAPDQEAWGGALSLIHVPRVFSRSHHADDFGDLPTSLVAGVLGPDRGCHAVVVQVAFQELVWRGNTALYSEYGKALTGVPRCRQKLCGQCVSGELRG